MARILVIVGKFNELVTNALLAGAMDQFSDSEIKKEAIDILSVPGSFEIPVLAARAARGGKYAAIVCLGAVIRGDTPHFDFVAGNAASGLMTVSIETGVPIIFGILTTNTVEQALSRCGLKGGNKGRESPSTALAMIKAVNSLQSLGPM